MPNLVRKVKPAPECVRFVSGKVHERTAAKFFAPAGQPFDNRNLGLLPPDHNAGTFRSEEQVLNRAFAQLPQGTAFFSCRLNVSARNLVGA